ncbi:MAG: hypothetical protein K2X37_05655 [Chitinophagaceae bacterium]|nr:hypothetical protein [Chitinophagaceae bacterium]
MKKQIVALCLVIFLISGCTKNETDLPAGCISVKLIKEMCGNAILQIQDSKYYNLGVDNFTFEGKTYDHVFTTRFSCQSLAAMPQTLTADRSGLVFNIKFLKEPETDSTCATCLAVLSNTPNKYYATKYMKTCD